MENSKLLILIRSRATKNILRDAESMTMYDQVAEFLGENNTSAAISLAEEFAQKYPCEPQSNAPPLCGYLTLMEVCEIDADELRDLSWIYVHVLQTLTWADPLAAKILNERLAASPAAAWRKPLPEEIFNGNSFSYIFNEWYSSNKWIHSFEEWRLAAKA